MLTGIAVELAVAAGLIVVLAAAVQSTTGFGFSIVAVPPLTIVFGVREGIVLNLTLSLLTSLSVSTRVRRSADRAVVRPVVVGGMVGLVPGLLLFHAADVSALKVAIAAVVVFAALAMLLGLTLRFQPRPRNGAISGFASGFLSGSVGLGGPPVTLYLAGLAFDKEAYRASMSRYFSALYLVLVPTQIVLSRSLDTMLWAVLLLPCLGAGGWLGHRVFTRIKQQWFDRLVVIVVLAAGLAALQVGTS